MPSFSNWEKRPWQGQTQITIAKYQFLKLGSSLPNVPLELNFFTYVCTNFTQHRGFSSPLKICLIIPKKHVIHIFRCEENWPINVSAHLYLTWWGGVFSRLACNRTNKHSTTKFPPLVYFQTWSTGYLQMWDRLAYNSTNKHPTTK